LNQTLATALISTWTRRILYRARFRRNSFSI